MTITLWPASTRRCSTWTSFFHVGHVQAHRGPVDYVEGVRGFLAAAGDVVAYFAGVSHPLDALRLADALGPSRAERTEGAEGGFTFHGRQSLSGTCWAAWTKSLSVDSKVSSWRPHS